jgi:RHS repeat-associated protein
MAAATVTREDGQVDTYQLQAGTWVGEQDVHDALTEQADSSGNPTAWALVRADTRSTEQFNAAGSLTSINAQDGSTVALTYSDASTPISIAPGTGYLLTVTDSSQRSIHFIYDASGRISQIAAPDGGTYNYAYDSASNLITVLYPDGKTSGYLYDEAARNGGSTIVGLLTGILDEAGSRFVSYSYNAAGKAIENEQAGGTSSYALTYNSDGSVDVVDPYGKVSHRPFMTVDGTPLISGVDGACASCSTIANWAYDFNNELVQTTDFNGHVVTYKHDGAGLETVRVEASGDSVQRSIQTDWNDALHVPVERRWLDSTSALIKKTDWIYNTRGQPLAQCDIDPAQAASYTCAATGAAPAGVRRWAYTYCDAVGSGCPLVGLMLSATGPRTDLSQTTTYTYYTSSSATNCGTPGSACYQAGDLDQVTDALGHVTTYASYDANGRVTRVTDANGINTDLTYTPRGWLASRSIGGATTTLSYTAYGAVASLTDPDGITTRYTYDAAHRLTDITDAQGNVIHYTLDNAGNKTGEQIRTSSGTVVHSLSRTYNTLGQLTALVDGLSQTVFNAGTSGSYDANGNLVQSADALGIQRKQGFDALNRLVSTIDNYNGTDTATKNTQSVFAYDARDHVEGVGDPDGLSTSYDYDGLGNRTALHSPDAGTSSDTYDAAGNRLTHTDAKGIVSTSTYDALNRRTNTSYADTTLNVSSIYDEANTVTGCSASSPIGRLTRVVEAGVTTVFCYDGHGNISQKKQITPGQVDLTQYTYTAADRLSSLTTPDQTAISYAHDSDGRISGVQVTPSGTSAAPPAVVSSISYLPFGPISSYTLGNGQTVTRTYDANYRLTDLTSPTLALHFNRDALGNIIALGNAPGASPATETYSYDPLYRLTGITDNGTALESYTYSPTGDRLSKTAPGLATGAYLYTSGTHQLASIGSTSRANDANGNTTGSVIGGNTYGFAYNGRNRLALVQQNGQTVGTYTYNAMGERIGKVATSPQAVTARYAYNEASQLIGEYGTSNRDYIWLGDIPVAVIDNTINGSVTTSTVNYVTADQLGTPRAVTNSAGTVIWTWAYAGNPFGEQQPTSSAGYVLNLRYPGQYYDTESGLVSNGMRPYEAALGRFDQSDPSGLAGGMSTYAADLNNPLSYFDPDGRHPTLLSYEIAANSHPSAWNRLVGAANAWWNQTVQDIATVGGVNPNANMGQAILAPIRLGLTFSPMCLEEGAASAASAWPESSLGANAGALNAADFQFSQTALNHIADRPYMDSTLLMQQLMDATPPSVDPGGIPLGLRWDSPGTMNGSVGAYQLVVDPTTNTVYHFQFKGGK